MEHREDISTRINVYAKAKTDRILETIWHALPALFFGIADKASIEVITVKHCLF